MRGSSTGGSSDATFGPSRDEPGSLARGALIITLATAVSRLTGFVRVVAVAGAMGATYLANTYQTANTAPNLIFELVAAGVLTSVFVPTFVDYFTRDAREEGWQAANAMTSVAIVGLLVITALLALGAPLIMKLLMVGTEASAREDAVRVGTRFLILFAPQVVFYGAGMIMTGALHAERRFLMPAIAPIFNNVVVIVVYVTYAVMRGAAEPSPATISGPEIFLLGAGTTAGVIAMTVCLIPALRRSGWRFRFTFQPGHPAVKRGARLGAWALGYAGGYQAGLIVVLLLANRVEGGVAAYQWAYTFFYLPHALIGVPLFNVLFTAMSEHASRDEPAGIARRLRDGLRMLAFILLPVAAGLAVLAEPLARFTLRYGVMDERGAQLVGEIVTAFAIGLPVYSLFLVVTRGFYALGDARTPALWNLATVIVSSLAGTLLFLSLSDGAWVPGLALGHSLGFAVGAVMLTRRLFLRIGEHLGNEVVRSVARSVLVSLAAGGAMFASAEWIAPAGRLLSFVTVLSVAGIGAIVYVGVMALLDAAELRSITGMFRGLRRNA
jgi:putative peptidoglycan lipid II flippase